jgi:metal-responsive CopG/Arc/MetJ family transcriptional regulator
MITIQRVTLTLPGELVTQARELSNGNLSQFVSQVLSDYIAQEHRRRLREALIAGAIAQAEEALAIAEEFSYTDYEVTMRYCPPSHEQERSDAS